MKKYSILVLLVFLTCTPLMASASSSAQKLGVCLTDALNGKERKNLAKWIYFGMSQHSTIKPYSNISKNDRENMDRFIGGLITRLMTEDCSEIAKIAFKENGSSAFKFAFGIVGKVAMQEIMTESSVTQSLGAFEHYLDQAEFDRAFK